MKYTKRAATLGQQILSKMFYFFKFLSYFVYICYSVFVWAVSSGCVQLCCLLSTVWNAITTLWKKITKRMFSDILYIPKHNDEWPGDRGGKERNWDLFSSSNSGGRPTCKVSHIQTTQSYNYKIIFDTTQSINFIQKSYC